jgi:SAM-dependent methyltransferase
MKQLVVKSEFLLQSLLRYPLTAPCPHCRSPRHELIARKYRVVRIVRCRDCGLSFSRPIYRSWMSANFYDRLYSQGAITALPNEERLRELLASGFRDTEKDAVTVLAKLQQHAARPHPTILEIGSSWGYFLYQARALGFDATGIEIATRRREFGRRRLGLHIVGDWDELPIGRRYDVIYTAHVLEHFTDLGEIFAHIAARLDDGGVLFAEVPNFDPAQFGTRCLSIVGAVHPLGFDSRFFRTNLPQHGLEITGVFSSWDNVPDRSSLVSTGEVIIVRAERRRTESAAHTAAPRQ